jgi:sugar/nucleoside kinase (ribokinase family)
MNEFEIERTTGIPTKPDGLVSLPAIKSASRQLLASGVGEWIIVHFPEGACALGHHGQFHIQGSLHVPQDRIVGTVGAGDAFAAGVLAAACGRWISPPEYPKGSAERAAIS